MASRTGTRKSSTSSVIATAKIPSLKAARRSRLCPAIRLYDVRIGSGPSEYPVCHTQPLVVQKLCLRTQPRALWVEERRGRDHRRNIALADLDEQPAAGPGV